MTFTISSTEPEVNMSANSLPELVSQAQQLLIQIKEHPQYKILDFHGDVTAGDAQQFLTELNWELQAHTGVDVYRFEGFLQ